MTVRSVRRIALWGASAIALIVYGGCSGGNPDPDPFPFVSEMHVVNTFGQLLAGDSAAHFVRIDATSDPTIHWPAPGTGTLRYAPALGALQRCFVFQPRLEEQADAAVLAELAMFVASNGMPERNVRFAFCNFDATELNASVEALFTQRYAAANTTGNAALDRARFLDGSGTTSLDVYRNNTDPENPDSSLGPTVGGQLYIAAFVGSNLAPSTFLNPAPYVAPFLRRHGSLVSDQWQRQEPTIDSMVIEAATAPDFSTHVDETLLNGVSGSKTVAGLARFRIKLQERSDATLSGPTIAPFSVDYELKQLTGTGAPRVRSVGRYRSKELKRADSVSVGRAAYDAPRSNVGANRLWTWVPFGTRAPVAVDTSSRNLSRVPLDLTFDLEAKTGPDRVYPAGEYEMKVTVTDPFSFSSATAGKTWRGRFLLAAGTAPEVAATTVRFKDFDELTAASTWTVDYQVLGVAAFDKIRWKLFRATDGTQVKTGDVATAANVGSFTFKPENGGTVLAPGWYDLQLETLQGATSKGIGAKYRVAIYRMTAKRPGAGAVFTRAAPGIYVLRNDDDDNSDGTDDGTQAAAGEDDLVPVEILFEPLISGTFQIATSAGPPIRAWTTAAKGPEWVLPKKILTPASPPPWTIHVEGRNAGAHELRLTHLTTGGIALTNDPYALSVVGLDVLDGAAATVDFVRIGNWQNAYGAAPANAVRNDADGSATGNFAARDGRRFTVQVTDPRRNTNAGTVQTITASLGTLDGAAAVDDNQTNVTLTETGVNTGIFRSVPQLLTSRDTIDDGGGLLDPDDDFNAHSGPAAGAAVGDDLPGDRTHRAEIDGAVRVLYQPTGYPAVSFDGSLPVCQRGAVRTADSRLVADLNIHVFREPFDDVGFDHDGLPGTPIIGVGNGAFDWADDGDGVHERGERSEPYRNFSGGAFVGGLVRGEAFAPAGNPAMARNAMTSDAEIDRHIARTNLALAQACIRVNDLSRVVQDAPFNAGADILLNGQLTTPAEAQVVYNTFNGPMLHNVVEVFYVGNVAGANAESWRPGNVAIVHGEHSIMVLDSGLPVEFRTLAHELGHILTNTPHSPALDVEYYPLAAPAAPGVGGGVGPLFNDQFVNTYRRLFNATETGARTIRAVGAGHTGDAGNSILRNP